MIGCLPGLNMNPPETFESLNVVKGFKLAHLNVRSIVKKMDQIRVLLAGSSIDIFTISESWLKPHLSTNLIGLEGYQVFRLDRRAENKSKGKGGGGLVTFVNNKHSSSCEPLVELDNSDQDIEAQWTQIHRPRCKNIVICNLYRPPKGDLKNALIYLNNCLRALNLYKTDLFIMGDLNINYQNKSSPGYKRLSFFNQSNGLSQYISSTTRNTDKSKSLIDLVLSNSKFVACAGTLQHFISDHQPIFVVHKKGRDSRKSVTFEGRSYRDYDKDIFRRRLLEEDWRDYFQITDPDLAWEFVLRIITKVLDTLCPLRKFQIKNYRPDWMSKELIEQIKDRDYFYCKAKKTGDADLWNMAKHLRNVTNSNIRMAKREFILQQLNNNENNAKKFWKVIREVAPSGNTKTKQDIFLKDGSDKVERDQVAQFINDYFINVGNFAVPAPRATPVTLPPSQLDLNSTHSGGQPSIEAPELLNFDDVIEMDVIRAVKQINVSKSSGLSNVSSFVVKEAFTFLVPQITYMFNLSIRSSTFPTSWKKALVVPIPKAGNSAQVQNYRPISLLPLPGKILEKLIHKQMSDFLEDSSYLIDVQHGFRKNHSTIHSVVQLTSYINTKTDAGLPTLATFIDFKKAFDCVQHPVLLEKLAHANLDVSVVDWVRSYLSLRSQRVYANSTYSSYQTVTQGVPQGSVLGPLFYILYANDLFKLFKHCKVALYADDTVLYTADKNFEGSIAKMQLDIDSLSQWCHANGIGVNTSKTKTMVFGSPARLRSLPSFEINYEGKAIQTVASYKYLGITLDPQLNYNLHITKTVSAISGKLKQFQRMRSFLNIKAALLVYKNMLLPILEYGDILFTAASLENRRKMQVLQNKGLRCALNHDLETSVKDLHNEAKLLKLKHRRELHLLNFMYDWSQDPVRLKLKNKSSIVTRSGSRKLLRVRRPKTERFKRSLSYAGPKRWNALPQHLTLAPTKPLFKSLATDWANKRYGQW